MAAGFLCLALFCDVFLSVVSGCKILSWKNTIEGLPSVIPKLILEVLYRLETREESG